MKKGKEKDGRKKHRTSKVTIITMIESGTARKTIKGIVRAIDALATELERDGFEIGMPFQIPCTILCEQKCQQGTAETRAPTCRERDQLSQSEEWTIRISLHLDPSPSRPEEALSETGNEISCVFRPASEMDVESLRHMIWRMIRSPSLRLLVSGNGVRSGSWSTKREACKQLSTFLGNATHATVIAARQLRKKHHPKY